MKGNVSYDARKNPGSTSAGVTSWCRYQADRHRVEVSTSGYRQFEIEVGDGLTISLTVSLVTTPP